ncbi:MULTISPECIES: YodC family protein [Phytobacter]|uniref:DUF2158 domain-containing protein n=1 Tax=Phytobacter diazotrophicus TaxID=395631 RepID=A0ABM7W0D4_9ENTR|nr:MULTISPECIES: DUF2158 domain-containing protein [Phytobacter]BBE79608.1 hypothetical protein MRY16398_46640 [Phytobacter sp. MRY16-398]BDD52985.1 hypothetical protein PDTA9734_44720 [Phytobacter diazotrophicus]BEG83913.1 hypothetical protein PDTA9730_43690 [Phytobacter diazotrophicus]BEG89811.1 hypothetical protein PDTA9759_44670 [Phytobacter diazotrophicus]BEG95575.1 hypothetical protein PDTA9832_44340 [Phytobacter diazotrophicus]
MYQFAVGDKVQLKVGGPEMVIGRFTQTTRGKDFNGAECFWVEDGKNTKDIFPFAVLEKVPTITEIGAELL